MSKIVTDNFKRRLFYFGESFRFARKLCESNTHFTNTLTWSLKNTQLLRRVTAFKVVNRCIETGRVTGAGTSLKLSRIEFLRLARESSLISVKKRSR